ncbi:MAG: type II secretion system protein [Myxococcota bacterium]
MISLETSAVDTYFRAMRRGRIHESGMTLIELGLTLAITSILLAVAVPRLSALADTAKQEAVANDLVSLSGIMGRLVEKLAYPLPGPTGVVIPRTSLTAIGSLPGTYQTAIDELLPDGFDGLNPLNDAPYFISMSKPNLSGSYVMHDNYIVTIDTCIPDDQLSVATVTARPVEVDAAQCGGGQALARFEQVAVISGKAREMRKQKRMIYCCETLEQRSGGNSYFDLDCSNWRTTAANPQPVTFWLNNPEGIQESFLGNVGNFCR